MTVISAAFGKQAAPDLADTLRELADAVDRGEIVELVAAYVHGDEYAFTYSASISKSLELATLMQRKCVDSFIT